MSSFPMAGRGPKARYYSGLNSLAIFSAQGSNPVQDCKVFGKGVTKVYDKIVKGYVYSITGGLQSKLQLPKDDSKTGLQLLHHFLVLQVFVPEGVHFSVELRVSDTSTTRRKMYFSTSFNEMKSTPLHCRIPISMVIRNKWLSLVLHVADLFNSSFRGASSFRSTDVIILGPVCKLRRIFTMRCRISAATSDYPKAAKAGDGGPGLGGPAAAGRGSCRYPESLDVEPGSGDDCLPQEHLYAAGVDACVQVLDFASVQSAAVTAAANATGNSGPGALPLHIDHAVRENGLNARKGGGAQQTGNKGENGRTSTVHVAFGTRMPLPLSTVQINTSLPHDKSPTLVKDRIGRVHFISDPAAAAAADQANDLDNLKSPSRTMGVYYLDKEAGPLQQQLLLLQRRNPNLKADANGDSFNSRLRLLKGSKALAGRHSHFARMKSDEKEHAQLTTRTAAPSGLGSSKAESAVGTDLDQSFGATVTACETAEDSQTSIVTAGGSQADIERPLETPLRLANSVDHSNDVTADGGEGGGGGRSTIATTVTETTVEKGSSTQHDWQSPTSKWIPRKREVVQTRRAKEYKHTRYEDSPPESPPCGWDRCTGGNQSDDLGFHDHFLDGSWMMNSQLSESVDAESEKRSEVHEDEDSLMSNGGGGGGDVQHNQFSLHHSLPKNKNGNGFDLDTMTNNIFSSIRAQDIGDSFDFASEPDTEDHNVARKGELTDDDTSPPRETPMQMMMSASDGISNFKLDAAPFVHLSSDGDLSTKSGRGATADQHQLCGCPTDKSKDDQLHAQLPDRDIVREGLKRANIRPDDDLDLLYDPTLDCYYDPKTNRYYELK